MKGAEIDRVKQCWMVYTKSNTTQYLLAIILVAFTALLSMPLSDPQSYHMVSFILLFVVSIMATFLGIGPVFVASALSALVWNFFFIPPNLTFHIDKTEDLLMFGMFFIIALLNGIFTTRVRRQEQLAIEREKRTNALYQLTRSLSGASGTKEVLNNAISEIIRYFELNPFFVLQDGNNILSHTGRLRKEMNLSPAEYQIAMQAFTTMKPAGAFTLAPANSPYTFFPLPGNQINPGVAVIRLNQPFGEDQRLLWDTFLSQIANALEREYLLEIAHRARFLDESDRLYKTLFNSISHELRIPVATIMGASDTLLNSSHPENVRSALCNEIFTASLRLNRLIENLLNMSRLESGMITTRLDWYDMNDLINKVTEDLKVELKPYRLNVSIPENLPLVKVDFGLMEQVLYNLLYNATQYAPVASQINLAVNHHDNLLRIEVRDKGPGFPVSDTGKIFDKFYRSEGSQSGGLGLGLSIVKGFVEAHEGTVTAENAEDGGALFSIAIPSENPDMRNLKLENE